MKYVTVQLRSPRDKDFTKDFVVAFPNDFVHALLAKGLLQTCKEQWPDYEATVVAAGDLEVVAYQASGKSESLRLKSRSCDAASFNTADYGGNINVPLKDPT